MLCQSCSAVNPIDAETCRQCGQKLLVLSGASEAEDSAETYLVQAQEDLDEHMLERITTLEDTVRRLSQAVASTASHVAKLEHNLTVAHAGIQSLGGLLESHGIVTRAEIVDRWERVADLELLSRDLSYRYRNSVDRILSQASHSGHATKEFRSKLHSIEAALSEPDTGTLRELLADLSHMAPENDELWSFIGETAFHTGELETARRAFQRVLELRGPNLQALVYLGAAASDLGLFHEAEVALTRACTMTPRSFLPHFSLGALKVMRGEHGAAVGDLEESLTIEQVPQSWYLLGTCRLELGHTGRAIDAFRRAVALDPDFEDALYDLGIAYLRRGWNRMALDTFRRVLSLDPQRLQYQESVRLLSGRVPDNLPAATTELVRAADRALEEEQPDRALDLYAAALESTPGQPEVQATAALLASAQGRGREAVAHAHVILRDRPQDSPYMAAAVVAVLESLRRAGRLRAARRIAARLRGEDGIDPLAHAMATYELAVIESEVGDNLEEARDLAREALEIAPSELRHYPLSALGNIALKEGRYREATHYLEQASRTRPEPPLLRQLALARLGCGDPAGAEEALREASRRPGGGIGQEFLEHVRRLGGLIGAATRDHRPESDLKKV